MSELAAEILQDYTSYHLWDIHANINSATVNYIPLFLYLSSTNQDLNSVKSIFYTNGIFIRIFQVTDNSFKTVYALKPQKNTCTGMILFQNNCEEQFNDIPAW